MIRFIPLIANIDDCEFYTRKPPWPVSIFFFFIVFSSNLPRGLSADKIENRRRWTQAVRLLYI